MGDGGEEGWTSSENAECGGEERWVEETTRARVEVEGRAIERKGRVRALNVEEDEEADDDDDEVSRGRVAREPRSGRETTGLPASSGKRKHPARARGGSMAIQESNRDEWCKG